MHYSYTFNMNKILFSSVSAKNKFVCVKWTFFYLFHQVYFSLKIRELHLISYLIKSGFIFFLLEEDQENNEGDLKQIWNNLQTLQRQTVIYVLRRPVSRVYFLFQNHWGLLIYEGVYFGGIRYFADSGYCRISIPYSCYIYQPLLMTKYVAPVDIWKWWNAGIGFFFSIHF